MSAAVAATPVAILADADSLMLWFNAGENENLVKFKCISAEHAQELSLACHRAFGIRTKENSFTTGLLHRDIEIACGL